MGTFLNHLQFEKTLHPVETTKAFERIIVLSICKVQKSLYTSKSTLAFEGKLFFSFCNRQKTYTVLCQSKFLNENFPCGSAISKKDFTQLSEIKQKNGCFFDYPQFTKISPLCLGNLRNQTNTLLAHLLFTNYFTVKQI